MDGKSSLPVAFSSLSPHIIMLYSHAHILTHTLALSDTDTHCPLTHTQYIHSFRHSHFAECDSSTQRLSTKASHISRPHTHCAYSNGDNEQKNIRKRLYFPSGVVLTLVSLIFMAYRKSQVVRGLFFLSLQFATRRHVQYPVSFHCFVKLCLHSALNIIAACENWCHSESQFSWLDLNSG